MGINKVNLDRKPLDKAYIYSKQDFQQLIEVYKKTNTPIWKQPLFYGVVGFASILGLVAISMFQINTESVQSKSNFLDKVENRNDYKMMKSQIEPDALIASSFDLKSTDETARSLKKTDSPKKEIVSINQIENVPLESHLKETSISSHLPNISGYFMGDIPIEILCTSDGIKISNIEVDSFKLHYSKGNSDKIITIQGNKIPESVCLEIANNGADQMLFFTEIKSASKIITTSIPNMNLWIKVGS